MVFTHHDERVFRLAGLTFYTLGMSVFVPMPRVRRIWWTCACIAVWLFTMHCYPTDWLVALGAVVSALLMHLCVLWNERARIPGVDESDILDLLGGYVFTEAVVVVLWEPTEQLLRYILSSGEPASSGT